MDNFEFPFVGCLPAWDVSAAYSFQLLTIISIIKTAISFLDFFIPNHSPDLTSFLKDYFSSFSRAEHEEPTHSLAEMAWPPEVRLVLAIARSVCWVQKTLQRSLIELDMQSRNAAL